MVITSKRNECDCLVLIYTNINKYLDKNKSN